MVKEKQYPCCSVCDCNMFEADNEYKTGSSAHHCSMFYCLGVASKMKVSTLEKYVTRFVLFLAVLTLIVHAAIYGYLLIVLDILSAFVG